MTKIGEFLKKQPLITAIIGIAFAYGGINLLYYEGIFATGVHRFVLALMMCTFLYLISGKKTFKKCEKTTGYVIKRLSGILIFAAVFCVIAIAVSVYQKATLSSNWPIQSVLLLFMMIGVGLFEELAFRAVINDGIVYQFRDKKWVFAASAIISSLLFGYLHVIGYPVSTPLFLAQVILKTISTGLWGFAFLIIYWKTRNIWACGILHGLYDYIIKIKDVIFASDNSLEPGYVNEGMIGRVAIGYYIFISIFMLILLLVLRSKVLKTIDFEEMRANW